MSLPRKIIDWQAYDLIPEHRGKDAEVARSYDIDPRNFPKYKKSRDKDTPTIVDMAIETVDLTPPTPPQPATRKIKIADLVIDAGTQMRESLNLATIADYAEAMNDGSKFPPVIVFTNGATSWLGDGFQRVKAAEHVGFTEIEADIRPGTLRDAILFACGANAIHGERRTNQDKRKSVRTLLDDSEWAQWSDNRIAGICGVSQPFVSEVRQSLITVISEESNTRQYVTKHGTTATMSTSNIGKRATGERKPKQSALEDYTDDGVLPAPNVLPGQLDILDDNHGSHTTKVPEIQPTPPATSSWLPQLINEAITQLQHLGDAANLEGYSEYQDLHETLLALQEHIGLEVDAHA